MGMKIKQAKKNKPTAVTAAIIYGLTNLVMGQKRFAEEMGLSLNRIFPQAETMLQQENIAEQIKQWLDDDNDNVVRQLFETLVKHQLALMASIDGIVLHTLNEISSRTDKNLLKGLLKTKSRSKDYLQELKNNQRLRYQKLIVPGFVKHYVRVRETL